MSKINFKEENVTIQSNVTLRGTLTIPMSVDAATDNPQYPAVLFLSGSGRIDRNENNPSLRLNIFNNLADMITNLGIVTLRYDKRGVGESTGEYLKAGLWDLVDDAEQALLFLKQHEQVDPDKVFIIGHSEGAIIGAALADKYLLMGLVMLSGTAESLKDTMIRQNEKVFKEMENLPGFKGLINRLLRVSVKGRKDMEETHKKILESTTHTLELRGKKINAKWMREHFKYNVVQSLQRITIPTLAISGSKDVQVPPDHAKEIANTVVGPSEWYVIEGMNHILREARESGSMMTLQKEYKETANQPLHTELITILSGWLKKRIEE